MTWNTRLLGRRLLAGELFLDIGEDVAVVGIGSQRMYSGNVDTTSIFGRPALNDGISLAYFSSNGLPVGEDTVGLVFPTGLTPDDIIFSYTPLGGQTTYVPVAMIGANWSQGDFNFDGDVDVWQFDGKGDAQQLSSNLGANLDIALEEAIVEEADAAEPLAAAVDWQSEYESTQSKAAKRKAVEATVDLLLATEWRS